MKRKITSVLAPLLLCILLAQTVQAAEMRAVVARPALSFSGTTAVCTAICQGNSGKDSISATLTLYQGTTQIDSWSASSTGRVSFNEECRVEYGKTYRLELSCSINGVAQPSLSTVRLSLLQKRARDEPKSKILSMVTYV